MPPRATICTITCNRPRQLELLAECILQQDYPLGQLEWVIIDDSTSDCKPNLAEVARSGVVVHHIHLERRLPIGAKRNLCHDHATTDLFILLDDDDYYPPTRISDAVAALAVGGALVAGCDRLPLLLLPEGSAWLAPPFGPGHATANTLAYQRAYLDLGHQFDPEATEAEEPSFLDQFCRPIWQLDPLRTLTCIGHGGNTVDKRLWINQIGQHRFERKDSAAVGWPPPEFVSKYCRAVGLLSAQSGSGLRPDLSPQAQRSWRVAVITPYHRESVDLLGRCHRSVLAQEHRCTHVLVADGPGHAELDGWDCRHIKLGVSHDDNGNTPRAIGAIAAMNEEFDCIAFLDADNWYASDHISRALAIQAETDAAVVFSDRHIVFPSGQRLTELPIEDLNRSHADTSCMVLFASAFSCLALWAQIPPLMAPQCDRLLFAHLRATQRCAWTGAATVFFETWYVQHFLAAGLLPPLNAKFLAKHPASAWEDAAEAFRQRSPTPLYPGSDGIGSSKPQIQLVSLFGPARSGGTLLQCLLCRHLGFQAIPEHQGLFHLVHHAGDDHRQRHACQLVCRWLADGSNDTLLLKPHDRSSQKLQPKLHGDRTYTLLEAYFRIVQSLMPETAIDLAKSLGQITVLDRSCSHALVADVMFRCLPEHRALLVVRDPIQQITSVLTMQRQYPHAWGYLDTPHNLRDLCRTYLQSLAVPLASAPVGQLHLVLFDQLIRNTDAVVEQACRFLDLAPNLIRAFEPLDLPADHVFNQYHNDCYQHLVAALPGQLLRNEPWKGSCLPHDDAFAVYARASNDLPADELWLVKLMQPIQHCIAQLSGDEEFVSISLMTDRIETQVPTYFKELESLVQSVVLGLKRHSGTILGVS